MNLTVNGQSQVPPGFRFHPTEEELLHYYLKKKVANQKIDLDVIQDVDLNKLEPWDIQEKCKIGSSAQNDWYFFSHKDKKYPTGTRTNRATIAGFWKATGRDKVIRSSSTRIGMRKTLVFYKGRAPRGEKSDWIMHEYRLDDENINHVHNASSINGGDQYEATEEGWVICRVFKKKNYVKAFDSPRDGNSSLQMSTDQKSCTLSPKNHDLDEIFSYMEKKNTNTSINSDMAKQLAQEQFFHLPTLETPTDRIMDPSPFDLDGNNSSYLPKFDHGRQGSTLNWAELDRLVAHQLNGEGSYNSSNHYNNMPFFLDDHNNVGSHEHTTSPTTPFQRLLQSQHYNNEIVDDDQLFRTSSPLLYPIN